VSISSPLPLSPFFLLRSLGGNKNITPRQKKIVSSLSADFGIFATDSPKLKRYAS
jgi:hypothetical protein